MTLKLEVRSYMLPDQMDANGNWYGDPIQNLDSRREFPLEALLNLCEAQVKIFGEHEPIPNDTPWAYRWDPDPTNPRLLPHTGDPAGIRKPCFSIGWGKGIHNEDPNLEWWTEGGEIDQPVAALTIRVKRAGPLGFDLAMWHVDKAREEPGARLDVLRIDPYVQDENHVWHENPEAIAVGVLSPGNPPDTHILPLPEPVGRPGGLTTLADGPTEGMDLWAAWRDGRANGLETAARLCDGIPAIAMAALIRQLKVQP